MDSNVIQEKDHVVPVDEALEHALLALVRASASGLDDVVSWSNADIREQPTVIHDLNGYMLFYDFAITRNRDTAGYVRVGANKIIGTPDISFEIGARHWDFTLAVETILSKVRHQFPDAQFAEPRLVCYSYPKLGVLIEIAGGERLIHDVASGAPIPMHSERPNVEGAFAWSFFDSLSDEERRARLQRYNGYDDARLAIPREMRQEMVRAASVETASSLIPVKMKRKNKRTLQYCDHHDETESRSHHCFALHAQEVDDYCAVAVCQMVLCYYRYYYTQDQIAQELDYIPGDGCPRDQSGGYESLTCSHLQAFYDDQPIWERARDEIDALCPLKSGVDNHARVCAGYSSAEWLHPFQGITEKKLYLYDPWPWDADLKVGGRVYWEDWDSIEHTNYVTARINCP